MPTMSDFPAVPAGWYPAEGDPPDTRRFWDGTQWQGEPQPVAVQNSNTALAGRGPRMLLIVLAAIGGVIVLGGLVVFTAGETLFGSDSGSIDWYNREVLETCDVPAESTLVRSYVLPLVDDSGNHFRSMSFVYASPLPANDVASFYGLQGLGVLTHVPTERSCRAGNRPSVLVLSLWTSALGSAFDPSIETAGVPSNPADEFWAGEGADVTELADPPSDTRSFVRLRLAQRETDGLFGLGHTR